MAYLTGGEDTAMNRAAEFLAIAAMALDVCPREPAGKMERSELMFAHSSDLRRKIL